MAKPQVFKTADGISWVAMLDHGCWQDWTPFGTWEQALGHALWLEWCANG